MTRPMARPMTRPTTRICDSRLPWALICVTSMALGCVGSGTGDIKGMLYVHNCVNRQDFPPAGDMQYDMQPDFFAGEPIEDPEQQGLPKNRLEIRIQRSSGNLGNVSTSLDRGAGIDTLFISIRDVREVGLHMGQPIALHATDINYTLRNVPPVAVALQLLGSCPFSPNNYLPADSEGAQVSTITFTRFGNAQAGADLPHDFKVAFGEMIEGTLDLWLIDERHKLGLNAEPQAGGHLTGHFTFELRRGAAGQTFP